MSLDLNQNDLSHVVSADRAHVWHHLSQHKQYETVDPRVFVDRVRRSRTAIGTQLMNQAAVAGIGNIYRCETLLLAGIDPHRPIGEVEDVVEEVGALVLRVRTPHARKAAAEIPAAAKRADGVQPNKVDVRTAEQEG